jgi:hypothetical protein
VSGDFRVRSSLEVNGQDVAAIQSECHTGPHNVSFLDIQKISGFIKNVASMLTSRVVVVVADLRQANTAHRDGQHFGRSDPD